MYVCYSWFKVIYSTHMLQPWKHLYNQCHMVANLLESSEPLLKQEWPPCSPRKVPFLVDTDSPVQPLKLLLNNQPVSPSHGCSTLRWLNSTNTTVRGSRHIMLQNKLPALLQKYTWKCKAYSIYNVHIEELNTHTHINNKHGKCQILCRHDVHLTKMSLIAFMSCYFLLSSRLTALLLHVILNEWPAFCYL